MGEGENNGAVGVQLMTDLVKAIAQANNMSELTIALLVEMRDALAEQVAVQKVLTEKLDELCGRLEVVSVATDILADVGANNSRGPTMKDFVQALSSAEREVFGDGDGDGDGDDDDDDDDGGGGGSPVEPEIVSPTRRSR